MTSSGTIEPIDPFSLLTREDKWFLGNGEGALFAPPFPVWLNSPGFWDEATIFQYAFAPLFTVAILDDNGVEVDMTALSRRWTPAEVIVDYRLSNGMTATEVRTVQPGGVFASEWRVRAFRRARIHLVAWTAQDASSVLPESVVFSGGLTLARTLVDADGMPWVMNAELACTAGAASWSALLGEKAPNHPHWRHTPFVEQWHPGGLPCQIRVGHLPQDALVFCAIHRDITLDGESASATFAMRIVPADQDEEHASDRPPAPQAFTLGGASRRRLREQLEHAPTFRCADPYLETYFAYRWYGLGLHAIEPAGNCYGHPAMAEGIAQLHRMNASSVESHVRELRWVEPDRAAGVLRSFFAEQREDGSMPALIYPNHVSGTDTGDANWGGAVLALDVMFPRSSLTQELYPRLVAFGEWMLSMHGPDTPHAASRDTRTMAKRVAGSVYAYQLWRSLERIAGRAGERGQSERWRKIAERSAAEILEQMWDSGRGIFLDVDPSTGARIPIASATGFYPFMTDIVRAEHVDGLERALLDANRFWTPFPVPTRAIDDPDFSATAELVGDGSSAGDSGRVRPITNSHIVEALANASKLLPRLRPRATELVRRFVHMLFHDGDLRRPNCYEHYNPFTGHASLHRGIDDHQHSWINDLMVQYIAGIRPHDAGFVIDPFPAGLEFVEIANVRVRGRMVALKIDADEVIAVVDGTTYETTIGDPIEIAD